MDECTLNDLLECSVCLERLDTTSKVLPCQHTFCRKCLEVIVTSHSALRCPECRVLVEIKIDELPPNVLLMRLLEGMKNASHNQINSNKTASAAAAVTAAVQPFAINAAKQDLNNAQNNEISLQQHINQSTNNSKIITSYQTPNRTDELGVQQQQQQQQQQQTPSPPQQVQPSVVNNKSTTSVGSGGGGAATAPAPHARALYEFISKEQGDLSFRKGDTINLRRRIDLNWYMGELNGRVGAFPANHVQVVVPLPIPQCKALYDFRMGPNEEEGCLTFKKGAIINVFRRVDQNWAEGRIGDCIGIFPIAFVEMNSLAKQLMDVSAKYLHYAMTTRNVPATPIDPNFSSDSSSTTVTTSPNSSATSNSSSISSTAPNSPVTNTQQPQAPNGSLTANNVSMTAATAVALPSAASTNLSNKEKRHSLNAMTTSIASNANVSMTSTASNRHSSEILSAPTLLVNNQSTSNTVQQSQPQPPTASSTTSSAPIKTSTPITKPQKHSTKSSSTHHPSSSSSHTLTNNNSSKTSSSGSKVYKHANRHSSSSSSSSSLSAANAFVALYPYKAQKSDELDLKKGSVYYVTERCQDGWFKGTNRSQKSGVFPGNYVAPLRHSRDGGTGHGASNSKRSISTASSSGGTSSHRQSHRSKGSSSSHFSEASASANAPPELPPRSGTSVIATSNSVWSKPLGQHVEAFFSRKSSSNQPGKLGDSRDTSHTVNGVSNGSHNYNNKQSSSSSAAATTVNLIKRFTNMKRSKSPVNTTTYSMDNPVFEDIVTTTPASMNGTNGMAAISSASKRNTIHLSHPVHVRSGSCPSQLLQSLPIDINLSSQAIKKTGDGSANPSYMFGSQRVKGHKERPTLHGMRNNMDSNRLRGIPDASPSSPSSAANAIQSTVSHQSNQAIIGFNKQSQAVPSSSATAASYHRKSQSLDAATISSQIVNTSMAGLNGTSAVINKNKTYAYNERFRCIVSYPPNSEFELELQVGDIVFVHKKRDNGWYKGTHSRTGKVGLFPSSFVEPDI